jgi:hypothetical protein
MMKKLFLTGLLALGCMGVLAVALAAEPAPSGTVKIASQSIAIGVGINWGDGTLTYQGKSYAFSVNGLSVADLGISSVTSTGEVFYLNKLSDFSGNYVAGESGIAIGGGGNDVVMKNENGVVVRLHGTQQGVKFTLAAQGVKLQIKN